MAITIAINSTDHTWSFKVFPDAQLAELVHYFQSCNSHGEVVFPSIIIDIL